MFHPVQNIVVGKYGPTGNTPSHAKREGFFIAGKKIFSGSSLGDLQINRN
jgi:hypothetical protein